MASKTQNTTMQQLGFIEALVASGNYDTARMAAADISSDLPAAPAFAESVIAEFSNKLCNRQNVSHVIEKKDSGWWNRIRPSRAAAAGF